MADILAISLVISALKAGESKAYRALLVRQAKYERQVSAALRKALNQMRGEMQAIYDKYAVDGVLTKAEMTRYARYAAMEQRMLGILSPALRANLSTIRRLTPEQYQASFFEYAWAMDNATGLRISWGVLNMDTITRNLANEMDKIATQTYGADARKWVRRALTEGLSQGKDYKTMARDLRKALDTTNYNAMRILRTEGQTAISAGQYDAYLRAQEKGIVGVRVWDATLDAKTRPEHRSMDGKSPDDEGKYHLPNGETTPYPTWEGLSAGQRINCRCRERFQVDGFTPQLRRTREQGIVPYQNYEEWEKEYGPTVH